MLSAAACLILASIAGTFCSYFTIQALRTEESHKVFQYSLIAAIATGLCIYFLALFLAC